MQEEWFQVSPGGISWAAKAKQCMRHSRYVHEEFGQLLRHNNAHHAISESGHVRSINNVHVHGSCTLL